MYVDMVTYIELLSFCGLMTYYDMSIPLDGYGNIGANKY